MAPLPPDLATPEAILPYHERRQRGARHMDLDPQVVEIGVRLGEATVRNAASGVADRIRRTKAKRNDRETINELEEIVNSLLADKNELVQIATAYEQELVAQKISQSDVEYITTHLIPKLKEFLEKTTVRQDGHSGQVQQMIDLLSPVLSIETVTVLQLIGFNFKTAIGEPLTALVSQMIGSMAQTDARTSLEVQRLTAEREIAYVELAKDKDSYDRLMQIFGRES
jgi:hypothetical protein